MLEALHVVGVELLVEEIFVPLDTNHRFNMIKVSFSEHASRSPGDFFELIQDETNFFISCLNYLEIGRQTPFSAKFIRENFGLHFVDDLFIKEVGEFHH